MCKGTKLSQDLSVTKSCFECSIWIVSVMHTASNNRGKSGNFDVDTELLSTAWNVLSRMEGTRTFSGSRAVQSFRGWTHPSLANLEGQLHAQDLKGVKIGSSASKTRKMCVTRSPGCYEERKQNLDDKTQRHFFCSAAWLRQNTVPPCRSCLTVRNLTGVG